VAFASDLKLSKVKLMAVPCVAVSDVVVTEICFVGFDVWTKITPAPIATTIIITRIIAHIVLPKALLDIPLNLPIVFFHESYVDFSPQYSAF